MLCFRTVNDGIAFFIIKKTNCNQAKASILSVPQNQNIRLEKRRMDDQSKQNIQSAFTETGNNPVRHLTAPKICNNPHCSFQTHEPMSRCPKCGRPIWTTNEFRAISSVLIFCGFLLLLLGGGLGYIFFRNYDFGGGMSEDNETGMFILAAVSGFIISFGLAVLVAGAWQVIFGRANWRIIKIILGFMIGMLLIAGFGRLVLYLLLD